MRTPETPQPSLGYTPIREIQINLDSRDDIPKLLLALQQVHQDEEQRQTILELIKKDFGAEADHDKGAPGMDFWAVFVFGVFRLGLDCDYDRPIRRAAWAKTCRACAPPP